MQVGLIHNNNNNNNSNNNNVGRFWEKQSVTPLLRISLESSRG